MGHPHTQARRMQLPDSEIQSLMRAEHGDPFAVLGPHPSKDGLWVRALLPGAREVGVVHAGSGDALALLARQGDSDLFAGQVPTAQARMGYRLQVQWDAGHASLLEDPYRFGRCSARLDVWLLAEGTHLRPLRGARRASCARWTASPASAFAVWAPNARRVSRGGRLQQLGRPAPPDAAAPRVRRVGDVRARRGAGRRCTSTRCSTRRRPACCRSRPTRSRFAAELRPATACVVRAAAGRGAGRRRRRARRQRAATRRSASTKCTWARGGARGRRRAG